MKKRWTPWQPVERRPEKEGTQSHQLNVNKLSKNLLTEELRALLYPIFLPLIFLPQLRIRIHEFTAGRSESDPCIKHSGGGLKRLQMLDSLRLAR